MALHLRNPGSFDWLLEHCSDGYLILDAARRATYVSPTLARILEKPAAELVGLTPVELFGRAEGQTLDKLLDAYSRPDAPPAMPPFNYEFHARQMEDGSFEVVVHSYAEQKRQEIELAHLKATMAVSQELLRHKNQELDKSLENMARMNEQLAHLDDLKSEFLSNTSHELRTPLNTIIGALQLMREGLCETKEEEQEYLGTALDAGQRLLVVINDVLDSAKLRAGKMNFLIEDHKVNDIFEEVYSTVHPAAKQKGLKLQFGPPEPADLHVRGDFEKARQILVNLVGNAVKFADEGEVTVTARIDAESPNFVRFTVTDTGIGIPIERQEAIFDRFTQVDGSTTRRYEGTGLGLAITRNLVEMMGGIIELSSAGVGAGTQVTFTLPVGLNEVSERPRSDSDVKAEEALPLTF